MKAGGRVGEVEEQSRGYRKEIQDYKNEGEYDPQGSINPELLAT